MEFESVLKRRKTTRNYTDQRITDSDLEKIIRAAQAAPLAAGDDRTTHLTVVRSSGLLEEIRDACSLVSRKTGKKTDAFYGAQTVIFVSATDISDDHIEYSNAGCVIETMILQATALDLGSTYIWGCLRKLRANESVLKKLQLPEGYQVLSALAVGYPAQELNEREITDKIETTIL